MKYLLEYRDRGSLRGPRRSRFNEEVCWNPLVCLQHLQTHGQLLVSDPRSLVLSKDSIYGTGNEVKDKALMLEAIQRGNFDLPNDPDDRAWSVLEAGNKGVTDFLEKKNLQSLAKTCSTVDELIQQIKENLIRIQKISLRGQLHMTRYPHREEDASRVYSYGFLAPVGSRYLDTDNFGQIRSGRSVDYTKVNYFED
jgi:hypothetical protein